MQLLEKGFWILSSNANISVVDIDVFFQQLLITDENLSFTPLILPYHCPTEEVIL
jgi:hypothetical protein